MDHMGHPIASNIRDCYLNLAKLGMQNEIPLMAAGGIGKQGNLAANAASLIMLGASAVQIGKYIMQAAGGCIGSESDRCNICNIGLCPKGITSKTRALPPSRPGEGGGASGGCVSLLRHGVQEDPGPLGRSTSLPSAWPTPWPSPIRPRPSACRSSMWSDGHPAYRARRPWEV